LAIRPFRLDEEGASKFRSCQGGVLEHSGGKHLYSKGRLLQWGEARREVCS